VIDVKKNKETKHPLILPAAGIDVAVMELP
jgi:hypothetical protein